MDNLSLAVITGVIVFSLSQYLLRFIFEPILEFKKTLSEISHVLLLNQAKIASGSADDEKLKNTIHALSAKLRSSTKVIPCYGFLQKIIVFSIPTKVNILLASHQLNVIGYGVINTGMPTSKKVELNIKALEDIRTLLNIETTYTIHAQEYPVCPSMI